MRKASNVPQNLKFGNKKAGGGGGVGGGEESSGGELGGDTALKGTVLAGLLLLGVVGGFGAVGYIYKDQVNAFLTQFSGFIEGNAAFLILGCLPLLGFFVLGFVRIN